MSEFKGTEGNWVVKPGSVSGFVVESDSAPKVRKNVASCGGQRREENARLIAAAPELLESLQCAIHHVREKAKSDAHAFGVLQACNSAIAKALGESK